MDTGSRMIQRQPIGYRLETKASIARESVQNVGVTEEAAVGVVGVEEGDAEAGEGKKFGEFEHGIDMALNGKREDKDMGRDRPMFHVEFW